jgi:hypothetical protein
MSIQSVCLGGFLLLFTGMILLVVVKFVTQRWDYSNGIVMLQMGESVDGSRVESQNCNIDRPQ